MAVNLLTIIPTLHITIAKIRETKSLPAVQSPSEIQASIITFSRSPPSNRIGLVKLCNKGVVVFLLIMYHICAENKDALINKDEAKNTMPPTAIMLVN